MITDNGRNGNNTSNVHVGSNGNIGCNTHNYCDGYNIYKFFFIGWLDNQDFLQDKKIIFDDHLQREDC